MEKNKSHEANLSNEHVSLLQRERARTRIQPSAARLMLGGNPTFCCSPVAMGDQAASSPLGKNTNKIKHKSVWFELSRGAARAHPRGEHA